MKLHTATALLIAALGLPVAGVAQDPYGQQPQQVYPAVPVGPETSAYPAQNAYPDQNAYPAQSAYPDPSAAPQGAAPEPGAYDVSVDIDAGAAASFETFQQPLASYGDWIVVGSYGTVWRPHVPAGWRPYFYGRWEWTTEGWLWVSDEPFGWATYHYGRWTFDRGAGWIWVPGYQWAPAWVSWRYSGDVVGWAPLAPGLSVYVTNFAFVDFWWTFVPTVSFCSVPVYGVAYGPGYARHYYGATRPAPPRPGYQGGYRPIPGRMAPPAWGGPAPRFVEERAGRPLHPVRIVPSSTPGQDRGRPGEIGVYRPEPRPSTHGRGPGEASPPGRGGGFDPWTPRGYGGGRGTLPAPAPGWDPNGRGPGPASPPGRGGGLDPGAPRGNGGGRGTAPVPAPGHDSRGAPPPTYQPSGRSGERGAPPSYQPSGRSSAAPAPSYRPSGRSSSAAPAPSHGGGGAAGRGGERGGGSSRHGGAPRAGGSHR